jgi:hypothetical protein
MTDLELIEYANKAGLCLATCWDLDELYNANAAEETERWVRDSQTANEREEKQAVANIVRVRAQEKMNNLRQFAELITSGAENDHAAPDGLEVDRRDRQSDSTMGRTNLGSRAD